MNNKMYNLPAQALETGRSLFWETVERHFGENPIDILEIGVFNAKCITEMGGRINFRTYTGVDPYRGENDSYTGKYWNNTDESNEVYLGAKRIFEEKGARLIRQTSEDYFKNCEKEYDFVFVDGDHGYYPALWDMCKWFGKVREGGLLMIDDYANVDIPDVTKAANSFFAICKNDIGRMGYCDRNFINNRKYIPAVSRCVYFEKSNTALESFSYNAGSSARNIEISWQGNNRKLAVWYDENITRLDEAMELGEGFVDCIICKDTTPTNDFDIPTYNLSDVKDVLEYYYLIPNMGTVETEKYLSNMGLERQRDFYTLNLNK